VQGEKAERAPVGLAGFFEINFGSIENGVITMMNYFEMRPSEYSISVILIIQTTPVLSSN
jgi:hypothetical protein